MCFYWQIIKFNIQCLFTFFIAVSEAYAHVYILYAKSLYW